MSISSIWALGKTFFQSRAKPVIGIGSHDIELDLSAYHDSGSKRFEMRKRDNEADTRKRPINRRGDDLADDASRPSRAAAKRDNTGHSLLSAQSIRYHTRGDCQNA